MATRHKDVRRERVMLAFIAASSARGVHLPERDVYNNGRWGRPRRRLCRRDVKWTDEFRNRGFSCLPAAAAETTSASMAPAISSTCSWCQWAMSPVMPCRIVRPIMARRLQLRITPGTYTWTWGTGANQNFTLDAVATGVPDSGSTFRLFLLSFVALFGASRFRAQQST